MNTMATGDPFCACGCGGWLCQCRRAHDYQDPFPGALPPTYQPDIREAERMIREAQSQLGLCTVAGCFVCAGKLGNQRSVA